MQKVKCQVATAPLRAENSDSAEMVSQLLYGEKAVVIEVNNNFTKIKTIYDQYEGWIDTKQLLAISEETFCQTSFLVPDNMMQVTTNQGPMFLSLGSELDFEIKTENTSHNIAESIVNMAKTFINTPYLWGGRSVFGIDCSGFSQIIYKAHQLKLPRDAYQQAALGETLSFLFEAQPGDLAFFENAEGRIIHVGIMLNAQEIIHAHGKVRVDGIDSHGIFNQELKRYTHQLSFIKRFI
jgi:gamma-D-glutamyl-L-lysine dipeptidyl-peptidase